MTINCLYTVVNKKKPKISPRSIELEALELNDSGNEMYSNSKGGKPKLILQDTRDPSYSVIDKKKQVTDYIPEQEEEAPEIPSFDLSMMYSVD